MPWLDEDSDQTHWEEPRHECKEERAWSEGKEEESIGVVDVKVEESDEEVEKPPQKRSRRGAKP